MEENNVEPTTGTTEAKPSHFSKDAWLVASLIGVAFAAAFYFYSLEGPVAENLGLVEPVSQQNVAQVSSSSRRANDRPIPAPPAEQAFGPFGDAESLPARDGRGVFEGELFVGVGENFVDGEVTEAKHFYTLYDEVTGILLELKPDSELPPGLEAGAMLRARGVVTDGVMSISSGAGAEQDGSLEVLEPAAVEGAGAVTARSVLAILVNNTDRNLSCGVSEVEGILFTDGGNSVAEAYESASHGQLTIAGDVVGPFNVPYSSADSYSTIGSAARAAASEAGIDVAAYDHVVHVLPPNSATNYAGYGLYNNPLSWVFRCGMRDLYQHELGHNLNLGHTGRGSDAYNDRGSFMGYSSLGLRHAHAAHMDHLNWLPDSKILSNPAPGQYTIGSSDVLPAKTPHPQAIALGKADTNQQYYISYRTPTGYADNMPSGYDNQVQIHTTGPSSLSTTNFAFLTTSAPFVDSANGVTISLINQVVGESATIEISTNCTPNTPSVSISPSEVGSTPGGTANFTVSVKNNDSSYCGTSSIGLTSSDSSSGLSTRLSQSSISLAPGASANVSLTATSDDTITGDTHTVIVTATRDGRSSSDTALYTIDATAPSVPTNVAVGIKRKQVNITWNASTDNVGVAGYEVLRNGQVIATTPNTSYADRAADGSTNSYQVRAFDAAGNKSALSEQVTTNTSTGGGGPKKGGGSGDDGGGNTGKCSPWPSCRN